VNDPTVQLAEDLAREGRPSLAWCVEHVPDGDLRAAITRLWDGCADAVLLLRLCAHAVERPAAVLATCDCARAALAAAALQLPQPQVALEVAERRARGLASVEECRLAAAEAAGTTHAMGFSAGGAGREPRPAESCAAYAAAYAAEAAAVLSAASVSHAAARAASYAADAAAHAAVARGAAGELVASSFAHERARALAALAAVVRARVSAAAFVGALVPPA
jgi:hypothetical protein